ncbi:MAG: SCO family protein [Acidobacteria bacterium]|nr:SCO family protein [Acidobacteriota bacterium]
MLDGKETGDLITATLVVGETEAYLSTLTRTGHAPIEGDAAGPVISASDLLDVGDEVPPHILVDQDRTPRSLASLRGHRVALTFMYTRCPLPDFCPLMDRNFAEVQQQIEQTPQLADVRLVSVTLDPSFDTPGVLKEHARGLQAHPQIWHFVTGDRDEVLDFAKRFGVIAEPGDPSWMVVHNLRTAVIDPDGHLVKVHTGNTWTPAELVADLEAVPPPTN